VTMYFNNMHFLDTGGSLRKDGLMETGLCEAAPCSLVVVDLRICVLCFISRRTQVLNWTWRTAIQSKVFRVRKNNIRVIFSNYKTYFYLTNTNFNLQFQN
jgi:hypothetical protein